MMILTYGEHHRILFQCGAGWGGCWRYEHAGCFSFVFGCLDEKYFLGYVLRLICRNHPLDGLFAGLPR